MGRVKTWMLQEQLRKHEAMESMPDRLDDALVQLDELRSDLEKSNATISSLKNDLEKANSFKSKMKDYLIGGLIGAVLGTILSLIFF